MRILCGEGSCVYDSDGPTAYGAADEVTSAKEGQFSMQAESEDALCGWDSDLIISGGSAFWSSYKRCHKLVLSFVGRRVSIHNLKVLNCAGLVHEVTLGIKSFLHSSTRPGYGIPFF